MGTEIWLWVGFTGLVLGMLALDLGVFHRQAHTVSMLEAAVWSGVWIGLALAFNGVLLWWRGAEVALQFLTGYLIEKSLSVDNIFVFVLLFTAFAVPARYQHRVLFWGILGALIMRALMIAAGAALIKEWHWVIYVFGVFLIVTGIKMVLGKGHAVAPEHHPLLRLVRRVLPVTTDYHGQRFFVRQAGVLMATPLFLVLLMVEFTDLIFAVDSIPAIFAITQDPFIVYTSNVFAILGLRSLYFLLAGVIHRFHYLKLGLAGVLAFVGVKMLLSDTTIAISTPVSLLVIGAMLTIAIAASMVWPPATVEGAPEPSAAARPTP
ncbi:MAG: TerC family protein [Chloroflexi bacterium]|nr:TerC family protein [Chloroflexota bacterium]